MSNLIVLAGPNGAGKSTFHKALLADKGLPFVNADVLAKELSLAAYEAAALAERTRRDFVARGESFVTETVFSDPVGAKLQFFEEAVALGYSVSLFFIGLESPALSASRVVERVKAGGHDVPPEKIAARYGRTLDNLERALARLPRVLVYDNSSYEHPHRFLAEIRCGELVRQGSGPVPQWAKRCLGADDLGDQGDTTPRATPRRGL